MRNTPVSNIECTFVMKLAEGFFFFNACFETFLLIIL